MTVVVDQHTAGAMTSAGNHSDFAIFNAIRCVLTAWTKSQAS